MEDIKSPGQTDSYDFPIESAPERYRRAMAMDKQQARTLDKKHLFIVAYERNGGNVTESCLEAGVESRKTFYNWCYTDPEFKKVIDSTTEIRRDFVDDMVVLKILKGHGPTIRWWLSKHHPDYKDRREPTSIGHGASYNPFKKYQNPSNST